MTKPVLLVDQVMTLFGRLGNVLFYGEPVSQTGHALQTAWLAEQAEASPSLVAAALLHDVGHLLCDEGDASVATSGDPDHAEAGARFLAAGFPESVVAPVRLHVVAKRYLCTFEPSYSQHLTAASRESLHHQGGLLNKDEAALFLAAPYADDALALRRWDEMGRVPGLATPSLAHFRAYLEVVALFEG
jgi:phosphonate degradation associated HDIG domain protein